MTIKSKIQKSILFVFILALTLSFTLNTELSSPSIRFLSIKKDKNIIAITLLISSNSSLNNISIEAIADNQQITYSSFNLNGNDTKYLVNYFIPLKSKANSYTLKISIHDKKRFKQYSKVIKLTEIHSKTKI